MTTANDAQPTGTALTESERTRLYRAFGRMPYVASLAPPNIKSVTVESLAITLEKLSERLNEVARETQAKDDELAQYRDLIRGGRRLLAALLPNDR